MSTRPKQECPSCKMKRKEWANLVSQLNAERDRAAATKGEAERLKGWLRKYRDAIDAIYSHDEAARAAVVEHFGSLHPREVVDALSPALLSPFEQEEENERAALAALNGEGK